MHGDVPGLDRIGPARFGSKPLVELTAIGYVLLPVTLCLAFWPSRLAQLVIIAAVFGAAAPIVLSGGSDALATN